MAIRNTSLGGADFTSTTALSYADLNDTFDEMVTKLKNHWWDDLTPFDSFIGTDGDAVNSELWDTVIFQDGIINIQSNKARLDSSSSSCDPIGSATLTLKTALTSGRIIMLMTERYFKMSGSPATDFGYIKYYVGNDTDGWTEVESAYLNAEDTAQIFTTSFSPSLEAIYIGSNQWNIFIGGNAYGSNPITLANGLKLRIEVYSEGASSTDTVQQDINLVYTAS